MARLWIFLFFLLPFSFTLQGQVTSNKGKLFWVGFMDHIDGSGADMDLYITSDSNTNGTVSIPGENWSTNFTITANQMTLVSVPSNKAHMSCSDCKKDKGIKISSIKPVVVYSHIHHSARSDATLVLPTTSIGQEYFVMSYKQESNGQNSQFMIIASQDDTKVKITPTDQVGSKAANISYTINLDEGEVYQGQAPNTNDDLTGTKIEVIDTGVSANCRKISVFSGSSFTRLGCTGFFGSGDNLYQQLYPTSSWSNAFATVPFKSRTFDRYRILASQDNTVILIDGNYKTTLNSGQFYETGNVNKPQYIFASKPISVAQYQVTQACGGTGDPSMTILSPIQQTLKDITVYSSQYENITQNYINVVMPTTDTSTFTIDNKKVNYTVMAGLPAYSYAQIDVSSGNHYLKADKGFIAIAYGFGLVESYGYSAGANVSNLSQYIKLNDSKISNINTICLGETAKFEGKANFPVAKWEWDFGDDSTSKTQNSNHLYLDTGEYKVKMFTTKPSFDGCSLKDSAEMIIKVVNNPKVTFGFKNACLGDTILFVDRITTDAPGNIILTLWDFGDDIRIFGNNPKHLYDTARKFEAKLLVRNSFECSVTIKDTVEIYPNPKSKFFASKPCFKDSVALQDSTLADPYPIHKWIWNMGEGSIDTVYKDQHHFLYDTSGDFRITLTAETKQGCSSKADTLFKKYARFEAAFSHEDACLKSGITFNDTSLTSGMAPTSRTWDLGNGNQANTVAVKEFYPTSGDYDVKLKITQNADCADSITKQIKVYNQVNPQFTVQDLCEEDSAILRASHNPAAEKIASFIWNHKGSNTLSTPWKHQFIDSGRQNFKLISITEKGCRDTLDSFVTILPKPEASFTYDLACEENEITLNSTSKDFGKTFTKVNWTATTASSMGNAHTFNYVLGKNKMENVKLIVETGDGCADTVNKNLKVWRSPKINITAADACIDKSVVFTNTTTIDSSTIAMWSWKLSDGKISVDSIPTETYTSPGLKKAVLIATTNQGCINSDSTTFAINPNPTPNFTVVEECVGTPTQFTNTSTIGQGLINIFQYTFDDGNSSALENPANSYTMAGQYNVKLYTESSVGCKDSITKSVKSHAIPTADFTANPLTGCLPLDVYFTDVSTVINDVINEWKWADNSGVFSTNQNPSRSYVNPGLQNITLQVKSLFGCESDLLKLDYLEIYPKPTARFSYEPDNPTIIDPEVTFTDLSVGAISWDWDFGDGGTSIDQNPIYRFSDTGSFLVSLEITNANQCKNDTQLSIFIEPAFAVTIPSAFSPNDDGLNDAWGPEGVLQGVRGYELIIFNRWGEIIFKTNDINQKWDGTYLGKPVQEGFYPYRMRYTDYFITKWIVKKESLFLVR